VVASDHHRGTRYGVRDGLPARGEHKHIERTTLDTCLGHTRGPVYLRASAMLACAYPKAVYVRSYVRFRLGKLELVVEHSIRPHQIGGSARCQLIVTGRRRNELLSLGKEILEENRVCRRKHQKVRRTIAARRRASS